MSKANYDPLKLYCGDRIKWKTKKGKKKIGTVLDVNGFIYVHDLDTSDKIIELDLSTKITLTHRQTPVK